MPLFSELPRARVSGSPVSENSLHRKPSCWEFPFSESSVITAAILGIVWQSGKTVVARLLDGVHPEVVGEIREAAGSVAGVAEVRARWLGHRLRAEVNVAVNPSLSVVEGHAVAREVNHRLAQELRYLDSAVVHVDPVGESGEEHHHLVAAPSPHD